MEHVIPQQPLSRLFHNGEYDQERIADCIDKLSITIRRAIFIVINNAKVHKNRLMREMKKFQEKWGSSFFFLPSYSPHLTIAGTLWRILKGN